MIAEYTITQNMGGMDAPIHSRIANLDRNFFDLT